MSRRLTDLFSSAEDLLALEPEELGAVVLQILNREPAATFHRHALFEELMHGLRVDDSPSGRRIPEALGEAVGWLESQGLLASRPHGHANLLFVTKRGRQLSGSIDVLAYRKSTLLPVNLLHPIITQRAQAAFLRGEYDTAVFTAFKAVEVAVRKGAGLPDALIGTQLMSAAFNPSNGPLSAASAAPAEREAIGNLFAGAIGHANNPQSHRDEPVQPEDACHLLLFASYLLRLVDIRIADKSLAGRS